jgi:hypothetical protein
VPTDAISKEALLNEVADHEAAQQPLAPNHPIHGRVYFQRDSS